MALHLPAWLPAWPLRFSIDFTVVNALKWTREDHFNGGKHTCMNMDDP